MSYLDAGASILEWFPHRSTNTKLHPLPAMWLTPLKGFSLAPPLLKRARLQSDDVEMEGATPAVFPGVLGGATTKYNTAIYNRFEDAPPASCDIERATPTPPVSPGSNRASLTSSSAGGSPQRPLSGSSRRAVPPYDVLPGPLPAGDVTPSDPFPKPAGLLKAALVQTPPGTPLAPKRRVRAGRPMSAPAVTQPPVAPAADAEAIARVLSPLQPRVWSPMPTRKAAAVDPLADWGYTNPKPRSRNTPTVLQMDVGAFPACGTTTVPREMHVATTPPKPDVTSEVSADPAARPVFGQPMSPAQRARAKLILEGKVVYSPAEPSSAPNPNPVAMATAVTTATASIPVVGNGWTTSGVSTTRGGGGWVVGGGLIGVAVVGCAAPRADETETETDPESETDDCRDERDANHSATPTEWYAHDTNVPNGRHGRHAISTAAASDHGGCAYQLPGLVTACGATATATATTNHELVDGIGMFDWEYSHPPTATDVVPSNPRTTTPYVADGNGHGYGRGYGYSGVYGPSVPAVPDPVPSFPSSAGQHTLVEDNAATVTSGMVVSPTEDDGTEETAWGCRVPDTDHYTDHYSVSTTSLGWDGCYYGYGGSGGTLSDAMSDSDSDRAVSPTALEAAVSAVTVRGDANFRMGVIYDLV